MLGARAVGAIIGIISACSLFLLLVACCIVSYRRRWTGKNPRYVTAAQADDERVHEPARTDPEDAPNRAPAHQTLDSPPPYSEAIRHLNNV